MASGKDEAYLAGSFAAPKAYGHIFEGLGRHSGKAQRPIIERSGKDCG
jgi:hypothetical protein